MARRGRRGIAVAALVRPRQGRPAGRYLRGIWRRYLRLACPPVVAVLQPGTLGRAPGRHRADDRRGHRDKAHRSPVNCGRDDGYDAPHLLHPSLMPRAGRIGSGRPSPLERPAARRDVGRHPASLRRVHIDKDRRHYRRC